jgi:cytochrome b subunit of formate dehydrogenase
MKDKMIFLLFGIAAVLLTSMGYIIDSDPPYADFKMTLIEFSFITIMIFGIFLAIFFVTKLVKRLIKT